MQLILWRLVLVLVPVCISGFLQAIRTLRIYMTLQLTSLDSLRIIHAYSVHTDIAANFHGRGLYAAGEVQACAPL